MRSLRLVLVAAALLGLGAAPARAADPPALDVAAAEAALAGAQVYRAPGAIARFDEAVVLPELGATTKVVLAPPEPFAQAQSESYDLVYAPLSDWAREKDVELLLVTGLSVQVVGSGTVSQSDLAEVRETLAYRDVTEPLRYAARKVKDDDYRDDASTPDTTVPASSALVEQVVTGLRSTPRWRAPGADADLGKGNDWPAFDPQLSVRVAALPVLDRGTPYPDLLTPLASAFPGELVVVVRGSWIEATGPQQDEVASARNYTLGSARRLLFEQVVDPQDEVRYFLDRLALLRSGEPFGRAQVEGLSAAELWDRYAAPVALVLVIGLAGSSLLWFGVPQRRPVAAGDYRAERAAVFARLSAVSERITRGAVSGAAAERYQAAVDLLEQADAGHDRAVLQVAGEALDAAERELRA